jgi:hypothetical protein
LDKEDYPLNLLEAVKSSMMVTESDGSTYAQICGLHGLGDSSKSHNCLACNLAEVVESLQSVARDFGKFSDQKTAKITYLIWLYLLTERMQEILRLISFPEELKCEKFPCFQLIKRWGNFIKHPKAFLLTHHANYEDDGDGIAGAIYIDDVFINRFYSGDKRNNELYQTLTNQSKVFVRLPDLIESTTKLGDELKYLQSVILDNPIYSEILTTKSVLEDYYGTNFTD